ncbi:hypothetical protein C4867_16845 [Salmonella enterica subsp. enterica serovar Anatum]|nr:hypothetical protein C4867_16845 [Salmonella enterica subsp. enterica serovar Anatum]
MGRFLWLLTPVFFITSIIQLIAIENYFSGYLHWNDFISFIVAFILTWFPLIGGVFGILGAMHEWYWNVWQSTFLFMWTTLLCLSDVKIKAIIYSENIKSLRIVSFIKNQSHKIKNFTETDTFNRLMVIIVIILGIFAYLFLSHMR